jgi:hypothetical protein
VAKLLPQMQKQFDKASGDDLASSAMAVAIFQQQQP